MQDNGRKIIKTGREFANTQMETITKEISRVINSKTRESLHSQINMSTRATGLRVKWKEAVA
jgi:hypothetical protein